MARPPRPKRNAKVLRPLFYWAILVCVLFLHTTHVRLSARTNLTFLPILSGNRAENATARIDGNLFSSGEHLTPGFHKLVVEHSKALQYRKDLFAWYGRNDIGDIEMTRLMAPLVVNATPMAKRIVINGPDLKLILTNSIGVTSSVPADTYMIEAQYAHRDEHEEVRVSGTSPTIVRIAPKIGVLEIQSDQTNAFFHVLTHDDKLIDQGTTPALVPDVPEGRYQLIVKHHRNELHRDVYVDAFKTNEVVGKFAYGAAVIETTPSGAIVTDAKGYELGKTQLTLVELLPGTNTFNVALEGYEPLSIRCVVSTGETNLFQTNLVNIRYAAALRTAQEFFQNGRYDEAEASAKEALSYAPNSVTLLALSQEARGMSHVGKGKAATERGELATAISELNSALEFIPDNAQAKLLLADCTRREEEQKATEEKRRFEEAERDRRRQEAELVEKKTKELHESFRVLVSGFENANQFQSHELASSNRVDTVGQAIRDAFANESPKFQILRFEHPRADIFALQARQVFGLSYRDCIVVGESILEPETRILFKVLEFDHLPELKVLGSLLSLVTHTGRDANQQARFEQQIREGIALAQSRIEAGIK